jgi:hypothetical protein
METVIVGYLVAYLAGAGRRFADKRIDDLLDRLYRRVKKGTGGDPAIRTLTRDYKDPWAQQDARRAVAEAAHRDPAYGQELAELARELDERGARNLMIYAPQSETVVGINKGVMVRNGQVYVTNTTYMPDPTDVSRDAVWVKICFALGFALALAGIGMFGYAVFQAASVPGQIGPPEGVGRAAAVFFAGVILLGLAQIGHSLTGSDRSSSARGR